MKALTFVLSAAALALPLIASGAEARSATANQFYAAGHGQRPTFTNRPSRAIFHRNRYDRAYRFRHHDRRYR